MQKTSALWTELWNDGDTKRIYSVTINGVEYSDDQLVDISSESSLFDEFSIGNATCAELHFSIAPNADEEIPRGAKIERYVQLVNGARKSEKIKKGVFFINMRHHDGYTWDFDCYDAMRKADNYWIPDQSENFPMKQSDAVARIAEIMGIEVDPRNVINPGYTIDYPGTDTTMRDILGWIAAANGGNFIVSDEGKLRLVRLSEGTRIISALTDESGVPIGWGNDNTIIQLEDSTEESGGDERYVHKVGQDIVTGQSNGYYKPVSRVTLSADGQDYTSGDDTGAEIAGDCLYAAQYIADDLLLGLSGFEYNMFAATAVNIDLAFELGDLIEVDGVSSFIVTVKDDGSGYVDISAPGSVEIAEEYPAVESSNARRATSRQLAKTRAAIERSIDEVRLYVENEGKQLRSEFSVMQDEIRQEIKDTANNAASLIDQKLDSIKLSVSSTQTDGTRSYADITLDIDGDTQRGRVNILGDVNIDGILVANALNAVSARFNDITAIRINTSDKIQRYLRKDTSDFTYLIADGGGLRLYYAHCHGSNGADYGRDENGNTLYWLKNISNANIQDGWPYDNSGNRIYTTTEKTSYPVRTYWYTDNLILSSAVRDLGEGNYGAGLQLYSISARTILDQDPFVIERNLAGAWLKQRAIRGGESTINLSNYLDGVNVNGENFTE